MSAGFWLIVIGTVVLAIVMVRDVIHDLGRGRR